MYGFLRPPSSCASSCADRTAYRQSYCGQCAALQQQFGYSSRAVLSYDTTLIGLLIDAQTPAPQAETTAWCAVFPRKMPVYAPEAPAQTVAAALSVLLLYVKLTDSLQEKPSRFKSLLSWALQRKFAKARRILQAADFPGDVLDNLLAAQAQVETQAGASLAAYAEPSARFSGEVFRFTARLADAPENAETLYQIGYHIGRIVYVTDSCLDIADDVAKQQFNALLAAYLDNGGLSAGAQQEAVFLVRESLQQLRELIGQLRLHKHQALIAGIVLQGFPARLHQQVQKSQRQLRKSKLFSAEYLPHAALASVLCLFANEASANDLSWGKDCYSFNEGCQKDAPEVLKTLFSTTICGAICVNGCCNKDIQESVAYIIMGIPAVLFIVVLMLALLSFPLNYAILSYNRNIEEGLVIERTEKLNYFIVANSNQLASVFNEIKKYLIITETKLTNIHAIQEKYPAHSDITQLKINKLEELKTHLETTLNTINFHIEKTYVAYEADEIEGVRSTVSLEEISKQAQDALDHSQQVLKSVEETSK